MPNTTRNLLASSSLALTLLFAGCSTDSPEIVDGQTTTAQEPEMHGPIEGQEPDTGNAEQGPAKFNQTYRYESGAEVSITKIQKRPDAVIFTIKITNKTQDRLDAGGASVDVTYGPNGEQADTECCDLDYDGSFTGKILPGRSKSATFAYVIPTKHRNDVVVEVYADWESGPAIFQGSVK
jgi:hypothetical protein